MSSIGLVKRHQGKRNRSVHFREGDLVNVLSRKGGIFISKAVAGDAVENGSIMADIIDPYTGGILERVIAPCDGTVFFQPRLEPDLRARGQLPDSPGRRLRVGKFFNIRAFGGCCNFRKWNMPVIFPTNAISVTSAPPHIVI
jgi:hypothetical protein